MGIDGFWKTCSYRYLVPSEVLLSSFPSSSSSTSSSSRPKVGIDLQIGLHSVVSASDFIYVHNQALAFRLAQRYKYLEDLGFDLLFVDDGGPNLAKLASFQRRATLRSNRAKALTSLAALRVSTDDAQRQEFRKKARSLFSRTVSPSPLLVESFISLMPTVFNERARYMKAPFQADTQLVHLKNSGFIQAIFSIDSDLLINGAEYLLTGFESKKTSFLIASINLISVWRSYLYESPRFSIFAGDQTLIQRVTWATILGNDNLPGGVPRVGAAKLNQACQKHTWDPSQVITDLTTDLDLRTQISHSVNAHLKEPIFWDVNASVMASFDGLEPDPPSQYISHFYPQKPHLNVESLKFCSTGHPILPFFARSSFCPSCNETCSLCLPCPQCGNHQEFIGTTEDLPGSHQTVTVLSINPDFVEIATETELKDYLRSIGVHLPKDFTLEALQQISFAALSGTLPTKFVGTIAEQRTIAQQNVEAGVIAKNVVSWAYDWPEPSSWLPFDEEFFYNPSLQLAEFEILLNLFANMSIRSSKSPPNPHGIFGSYVMKTASLMRYKGGIFNILKKALAASVAGWGQPVTSYFAGFKDGMVVVKGRIHASMREQLYDTKIWLGAEHAIASKCTCVGGQIFDHHGMTVLIQLETALLLPKHSMLEILVDAFRTRFSTREVILKHHDNLKLILESIMGTQINTDQLLTQLLPGTERSTVSLNRVADLCSSVSHVPYRQYQTQSPSVRARKIRKKSESSPKLPVTLTATLLESYDPTASLGFDITYFDYIKIARSFQNCPKTTGSRGASLWFTTGAALVSIRSREQQEAQSRIAPPVNTNPSAQPSTEDLGNLTVVNQSRQAKRRSDNRCHKACSMPGCLCSDITCPNGSSFYACPRVSTSLNTKISLQRLKKRRDFLHSCGIRGKTNDPSIDPRVCRCHKLCSDGIPVDTGVKAASPSKRIAPSRDRRWSALNEPSNSQFEQIKALLSTLDELEAKNKALTDRVTELETQVSVLQTSKQSLRLSLLAKSPKNVWNHIRFSCIESFYCYLDMLCNCDRSVLQNLQSFRYENIQTDGYRNRSKLKTKYSHRKLEYDDEAFLYFMKKNGATGEQLALDFGISEKSVSLIIIKWTIFEYRRMMAFGSFLSYAEYCELCPTEWKVMYPKMQRCELWDTTKLYLKGKPSDQVTQKSTNSEYYGGNVLKGGVGTTPSGWRTPGMLFGGALDDTHYLVAAGIYQAQADHAVRDGGPPFHNIVDKGFKGEATALYAYGRQTQEAPSFRRRGILAFTPFEAVRTTNVAHKRGRNERVVWGPRSFGFVENGVENNEIPYIVDLLWHNIVIQCNFIFLPPNKEHCADWGRPLIVSDDE